MGVYIPNMEMPKECIECEFSCLWVNGSTHCMVDGEELFCDGIPQRHDCPLIEVDDELIKKLQESTIVIKSVFNRLKKMVNNSEELKTELIGLNSNLTIFDEANAIQDVESVGERRTDD